MPLLRLLIVAVPLIRRLLQNPTVRARLRMSPRPPARRGRRR